MGGPVVERACPLCASSVREHLVWLAPGQFCEVNPTYRKDVVSLLALSPDDRFPITRCGACGHVYAGHLPAPEFLQVVYERVIGLQSCVGASESAPEMARRARYVRELLLLRPGPGPRALDFGCGSGPTLGLLDAVGVEALGYEASPGRIGQAASRRRITGSWQEVQNRAPYDLVVCDNVLEHLAEPCATVATLAGLMRSGGIAYVSVPDYGGPRLERQLRAALAGGVVDASFNPWEHLSYFSLGCLDGLMSRAGLRRLRGCELATAPEVGLRPERGTVRRVLNALATARRLARYALIGRGVETPEHAFYFKS